MPFGMIAGITSQAAQDALNSIYNLHPALGEETQFEYIANQARSQVEAQVTAAELHEITTRELRERFHAALDQGLSPSWQWEDPTRHQPPPTPVDSDSWLDDIDEDDEDEDLDDDAIEERVARRNMQSLLNEVNSTRRSSATIEPPISGATQAKRVIRAITREPFSRDTITLVIKLVQSVAIKKYRGEYHSDVAVNYARNRVRRVLFRNLCVEYINDDFDKFSLVHPERVFRLRSEEGTKIASELTLRRYGGTCNSSRELWVAHELLETSRGLISPTVYSSLGYWECESCSTHREFYEEVCEYCNSRREHMEVGKLYSYSTDVRTFIPQLFDVKNKELAVRRTAKGQPKLYFGLELEVVPRTMVSAKDALYWVSAAMKDHALMKSDASLAAGGFEIVTAPATLEYHRERLWNNLFNMKLPNGKKPAELVKSWATTCCGLHVHFTKAALSPMQLSKMLVFYHEPDNARFLSDVAGRRIGPDAPYCKQAKKKLYGRKPEGKGKMHRTTADDCNYHREAICVSARNGGKTAEVRIFRGNITKHGVMRCLEFVAATIEWCGVNGAKELNYQSFLGWFDESSNRSRYPDLWKYLLSLRYLGTRHKSKNKNVLDELPSEMKAA